MKRKIILLLVCIATFNQVKGQEKIKGNKIVTTVKTDLKAFNKIYVTNDFKVVLLKSDAPAIEIETDENIHNAIDFNVIDSTLTISTSKDIRKTKKLLITVFYKSINEIDVSEDAEIESISLLQAPSILLKINDYAKATVSVKSDDFTLRNNNRSRIHLNISKIDINSHKVNLSLAESSNSEILVKSDSLNIVLMGNAKLDIEGSSNYLESTSVESTSFDGKDLDVIDAISTIKDNSDLTLQVSGEIKIQASEKSKINLYGNPKIIIDKFTETSRLYKKEL